MLNVLGIVAAAIFGVVAWLYQTALARQERRAAYYSAIIDNLPGFMVGAEDAKIKRDKAITASRHLWLIAHPRVVRAGNAFFEAAKGSGIQAEAALKEFVLQMRIDTSLLSVMLPWRRESLKLEDIQLYSGTSKQG